MSSAAFLFPGQGSQYVGMGSELYESYEQVKDIYDRAEEILGFPLKRMSFEGPEDDLKQTRYTQPAIFVHSVAADILLKEKGITPAATAGHSLGEYSALVSAGALTFDDGLDLVKIRGELMQVAGEKNPGTMAAIIGMKSEDIDQVCQDASSAGIVQPANYNCPGQLVISGSVPGVHRAMELAKENGARMAKELVVSGAFHSPLMGDALEGLGEALKNVEISHPAVPVYTNVEATPTTDAKQIRNLLEQQLMSPVRWEEIIRNMISDGLNEYYEVGPGKVLQGLLKRIDREMPCSGVGMPGDLA